MNELGQKFVDFLLENKLIGFEETELKSGRRSPYYVSLRRCDNGKMLSELAGFYAEKIMNDIGIESFDLLFGPAYAAIPIAAEISSTLWKRYGIIKRFASDRKEQKQYGDPADKMVGVGTVKDGDRILTIDDVITTGATKVEGIEKLKSVFPNIKPVAVLVGFDRQETGEERSSIKVFSIAKAKEAFDYMRGKNKIDDATYRKFLDYFDRYGVKE